MATIYVSEYRDLVIDQTGRLAQTIKAPADVIQTISITASSQQTSAFGNMTRFIRVATDTACHILIGTNPTATATSEYLPAGQVEIYGVNPGMKLAVIT